MAWTIPTADALLTRIRNDFVTRAKRTTALVRFSIEWVTAYVLRDVALDQYAHQEYLAKQIIPTTSTDEYLVRHANDLIGGVRAAEPASGFALVSGAIGETLPADALLTDEAGVQVRTSIAVAYTHTVEAVPVEAVVAGVVGNLAGNATLTLASPPGGFDAAAYVVASDGMTGGTSIAKATGQVVIEFTSAATLSAGASVKRLDGVGYVTDEDLTASAPGFRVVPATAAANGTAGNCAAGTYLEVQTPPAGVAAAASVADDGLTGGLDAETEPEVQARMSERLRNPPHGGDRDDYIAWTRATPGVPIGQVWPFGFPELDEGEVRVYFTTLDLGSGVLPSAGQVAAVQAQLTANKPMTADVQALAPTAHTIATTITLHVLPDYAVADVRAAILAELDALYASHTMAASTSYLRNSRIRGAIERAAGVDWYTLDAVDGGAGTADVTLAAYQFPTRGVATWA